MLSILIPTYNFDCTALATELQQQITASNIELGEKGYSINHIDNPIYNDVPDTNEDFLAKTRRSIENLKEHQDIHVRLLRSKKNRFKNTLHFLHLYYH